MGSYKTASNIGDTFIVGGLGPYQLLGVVPVAGQGTRLLSAIMNDGDWTTAQIVDQTSKAAQTVKITWNTGNIITVNTWYDGTTGAAINFTNGTTKTVTLGPSAKRAVTLDTPPATFIGYTPENTANKGVASGYAALDSSGAVPIGQLPAGLQSLGRSTKSGTYTLAAADIGTIVECTGTWTLAAQAAATLGNKWFCYLANTGTGAITIDPNAAELIDALASYPIYPGEVRVVYCDGTAFYSKVLHPFLATFTTSGTFIQPPGYSWNGVDVIAGGGGGGSGRRGAAGSARCGGAAGGGGARNKTSIVAPTAGTSITVTVAAGGTAGAGQTADSTNGNAGGVGGTSSFGTSVLAYGGGNGQGGTTSPNSSIPGSGGGIYSAGTPATPGMPQGSTLFGQYALGGGGSYGVGNIPSSTPAGDAAPGGASEWGGASGGVPSVLAAAGPGGLSSFAGAGGGSGGGITTGDVEKAGGTGGLSGAYEPSVTPVGGGGGAGGAAGGTNAGTAGPAYVNAGSGSGGGGGGAYKSGVPGAGGNGGAPGGGAGGGGASLNGNNSGAGGVGGRGEVRVWGMV